MKGWMKYERNTEWSMKGRMNEVWKEYWMKYERNTEWSMKGIINEVWKD